MEHLSIGKIRFGSALFVATTLKVLAALTLLGGAVLVIIMAGSDDPLRIKEEVIPVVVASTITSAAVLSFFGWVLEILVEMYVELWQTRHAIMDLGEHVAED